MVIVMTYPLEGGCGCGVVRCRPQAWVALPQAARAFEVYYGMARGWPAESLARREALLGGG